MNVGVAELRAQLSSWLERVQAGEEIVITERGLPVARLTAVDSAPVLERLTAEGIISPPAKSARPKATGRKRPRLTSGSASDIVSDMRR